MTYTEEAKQAAITMNIWTKEEIKNLHEYLNYEHDTGIFTWKKSPAYKSKVGKPAGSFSNSGYRQLKLCGKYYALHRVAWLFIYGNQTIYFIDHINGNRSDNRKINLREANNSINQQNQRFPKSNNNSGYLGVSFHKTSGKYASQITVNGVGIHLGLFENA